MMESMSYREQHKVVSDIFYIFRKETLPEKSHDNNFLTIFQDVCSEMNVHEMNVHEIQQLLPCMIVYNTCTFSC